MAMEMKERVNAKMLKLTIENKELKRRLVEWRTLQKEWNQGRKERHRTR
jgi:hypothetical protein